MTKKIQTIHVQTAIEPTHVEKREELKLFEGEPLEQMPELIADDRRPMDLKELIQRRLGSDKAAQVLRYEAFTTSTPIILTPDYEIIIAHYKSPVIKKLVDGLNPESEQEYFYDNFHWRKRRGVLSLTEEMYEKILKEDHLKLEESEFREFEIGTVSTKSYPFSNPELRLRFYEFITGSRSLAKEYISLVEEITQTPFENTLGLFLPQTYPGLGLARAGRIRARKEAEHILSNGPYTIPPEHGIVDGVMRLDRRSTRFVDQYLGFSEARLIGVDNECLSHTIDDKL